MVARISTVAFIGISTVTVDVQVQLSNGLPVFQIVGLADKAVSESRERVRSAISSLGLALPPKRIIINLAPADLAKEGSHYDLPIALGLLLAMDVIKDEHLDRAFALGELSLDGRIQPVTGVLAASIHASAEEAGILCPAAQGSEAAWGGNARVLPVPDLMSAVQHLRGDLALPVPEPRITETPSKPPELASVRGQQTAKRALEIAAAGGHNLLMIGPPGAGKSLLAATLPGLLPPLSAADALDVSMIHSIAGTLPGGGLVTRPPFRNPHHSASYASLTGGGLKARPGEVTLAHKGVLFLDELPEFARATLETLRQPVENGEIVIARANHHVTYPADFQLIAAMNPCRCGYLADASRACAKAPRCGEDYSARISGPLLDRFDLVIEVPETSAADLAARADGEPSVAVAARVAAARHRQLVRFQGRNHALNASVDVETLDQLIHTGEEAQKLLVAAADRLKLSARGYHRVLRVARTIADLDQTRPHETVHRLHIAEALSYRRALYK